MTMIAIGGTTTIVDGILTMDGHKIFIETESTKTKFYDTLLEELKLTFPQIDFSKDGHTVKNCSFEYRHVPPNLENK